jgi:AraC-like DNA-binding protein/mannose-6-phosphate isomerase-like protein (cupin superfamily)
MDIVSKDRHPRLWKPSAVASVNERLASAVLNSGEVRLGTLRVRCIQCHLGPGFYSKSHAPGLHQHFETQIEIPLTGHFLFTVNDSKFRLQPGEALLIPRITPHDWQAPGGGFMLGIQFSVKDDSGREAALPMGRRRSGSVVSNPALTSHLRQMIDLVASRQSSALTPVLASSLLLILVAEVLDEACAFPRQAESEDPDRGQMIYEQTCSFIRSNLGRPLAAKDLATQAGISFRQITRLFRKHGNESPHQSILRHRLESAKATIEKSPLTPIKEVAYLCGFSSQAHLAMAFKKTFGVSPSLYAVRKVLR